METVIRLRTYVLVFLFLVLSEISFAQNGAPHAVLQNATYDFGTVRRGAKVQGELTIKNTGDAALKVAGMRMSLQDLKVKVPQITPPGGESKISFELDTAGLSGDVLGTVNIVTNDPQSPEQALRIKGQVQSMIELEAPRAFFLAAFRWQAKERESVLSITNKDKKPLKIIDLKTEGDQFTANVKPIEEGQRYQIAVQLKPEGRPGRSVGFITIHTDEESIQIPVNTFLMEKVYSSTDSLDFGAINLEELERNPELWERLKQSIFVYKYQGTDFQIQIQAPPYLQVERIPAEGHGSMIDIPGEGKLAVFEIVVSPKKDIQIAGNFEDTIRITTNDKDFPVIEVAVQGQVVGKD